jgi:hypothetical protein
LSKKILKYYHHCEYGCEFCGSEFSLYGAVSNDYEYQDPYSSRENPQEIEHQKKSSITTLREPYAFRLGVNHAIAFRTNNHIKIHSARVYFWLWVERICVYWEYLWKKKIIGLVHTQNIASRCI